MASDHGLKKVLARNSRKEDIHGATELDTLRRLKARADVFADGRGLTASPVCFTLWPVRNFRITYASVAAALLVSLTGCKLLTTTASPENPAVISGAATTNTLAVVADIQTARAVNAAVNPTASEPLVDAGLGALAALITALSGWYVRHKTLTAASTTPATTSTPPKT